MDFVRRLFGNLLRFCIENVHFLFHFENLKVGRKGFRVRLCISKSDFHAGAFLRQIAVIKTILKGFSAAKLELSAAQTRRNIFKDWKSGKSWRKSVQRKERWAMETFKNIEFEGERCKTCTVELKEFC